MEAFAEVQPWEYLINMKLAKKASPRRTLADTLQKLLDDKVGERDGLAPFVKRHPAVLRDALMPHEWHQVRGVAEFRMGNELKADFVLLIGFSGGFIVNMVELESSTDRLLTKNGEYTRRFNHAYSQVQRWQEYARHPAKAMALKLELERQFREHEALVPWLKGESPIDNTAHYPLNHPESALWLHYTIVIGRRQTLTDAEVARKGTLRQGLIEVVSWDRLLDAAQRYFPKGRKIPLKLYDPNAMANVDTAEFNAMAVRLKKLSSK